MMSKQTVPQAEPSADKKQNMNNKDTTNAAKFSLCLCGKDKGLELILPLSLPKATIEPVNVTAPMKMPKYTSTMWMVCMSGATSPGSM